MLPAPPGPSPIIATVPAAQAGTGKIPPTNQVRPLNYAAHSTARTFFQLGAAADSATARELAQLGGHGARMIDAYLQSSKRPDPVVAANELQHLLTLLLPLTDGRRGSDTHAEFADPVRSAAARLRPDALVAICAQSTVAGCRGILLSSLLESLADRLAGRDRALAAHLRDQSPPAFLAHRDVIVLSYPTARRGDPGVASLLIGQALVRLEIELTNPTVPGCAVENGSDHGPLLLADCIAARRLGIAYLDELYAHSALSGGGPPPSLRVQAVLDVLRELGYPGEDPLGRAFGHIASAGEDAALRSQASGPQLSAIAERSAELEPAGYSAAACREEVGPLIELLGAGVPPAQVITSDGECRWPSARAVLSTSAIFNHVNLAQLARYIRPPADPAQLGMLIRERKDELVIKALELLSFGAAFKSAPQ